MLSNKSVKYLIVINFVLIQVVFGQWRASLYLSQAFDDNPFRLPDAQASWISIFDVGIQRDINAISLSYSGSFSRFQNMMERNNYWHQAALFGGSENTRLGIYAEQRLNASNFEFYDYLSYNAYIKHQFQPLNLKINWAADLEINDYKHLDEINNFKLSSSLRLHKSFPSRTTLIGGAIINFKKYINAYSQEIVPADTQISMIIMDGPGKGYGGRIGGGGEGGLSNYPVYADIETPEVSQLRLWLRAAQSLTVRTGLAVQYQNSFLLSGSNRFVAGVPYGYSEESKIFDDPMGYESSSIGSELTQLLPKNILIKGAFYYTLKNYSTQGVYTNAENYDGNTLRKDTYKTFWIRAQKSFSLSSNNNSNLLLRLNFQWINNKSNSYWYSYENKYTSLGLEIQI